MKKKMEKIKLKKENDIDKDDIRYVLLL